MVADLAIPQEEFERRLGRTQALLQEKGLDGLVAFSSYAEREGHVCYLTNHHISFPNVMSHMGLGHAALVLPACGNGVLVSPMGYQADKVVGIDGAKTGYDLVGELAAALRERELGDGHVGVAGMDVVPAEYYLRLTRALPDVTFEEANQVLESQRLIKSPAEVALLRQAARIADAGLQAGMEAATEGATQHDIELAAREAALEAGVDFVVRVRIVNGKRISTLGWPMVTGQTLERGDLVYLDFIGWFGNYGFDNSRVTVVGPPSDDQKDYLNHLVDATEWMIEVLKPGVEVMFPYTESRGRSIVPFGHGIGLEICENPWITTGQRCCVQPGMVVCVEPILNSPRFGSVTIEETLLVTKVGVEVLNACPRVFW